MRRCLVSMLWLVAAACEGGGGGGPGNREVVQDEGEACLVDIDTAPYGTGVTLQADAPATVRVAFDNCAPCGDDLQSSCSVTLSGSTLTVEAESSWVPVEGDCPADCRLWVAECDTEPLPPGSYTLVYGPGQQAFDVPSTGQLVCAEGD